MHYVQFTSSKSAQRRRKHRAGCSKADPQTDKQTHTNRQGRLQYTAQLSAQCKYLLLLLTALFNRSILRDYSRLGRVRSYREEPLKNAGARFFTGQMDALPVPEPTFSELKKYCFVRSVQVYFAVGDSDFCRIYVYRKLCFNDGRMETGSLIVINEIIVKFCIYLYL